MLTNFNEFVERQQSASDTENDWDEILRTWLIDLSKLHRMIANFLEEYVKAGTVSYNFSDVNLTEENIGTYAAPRMDIRIGKQQVVLEPIGTLLISCKGRVDVIGSAGRTQILLLDEKAKSAADLWKVTVAVGERAFISPRQQTSESASWAWKIVTQTVYKQFIDLKQEAFFAVLMEVTNG